MGSRMIRDRSGDSRWWLMVGLFTVCVVGWSLAFSLRVEATGDGSARAAVSQGADRSWSVADFSRVSISGSHDVTLLQGEFEGVTGNGDDSALDELLVYVEDGELIVRNKRSSWFTDWRREEVELLIRLKTLKRLTVSGASELRAGEIQSAALSVVVSGSSDIEIERLESPTLEFSVSGSADVELGGRVTEQRVQISGSADYVAEKLKSEQTSIRISGSGDARLDVAMSLDATVSGSGSVRYLGSPEVRSSVSGSGKIRPL